MKSAKVIVVAVIWVASLVAVKVWAQGTTDKLPRLIQPGESIGQVLTGENIGLQLIAGRLDSEGRLPVKLMVKVNGQWQEATTSVVRIVR